PGPTPWAPVAPANVDHNEVIGTCASCHNGTLATGKSATHINTTDNCDACHAPGPTPWAPAIQVDHNEVQGICSACHDGVIAAGMDPGHIQTTDDCGTCHLTTAWLPATVDHSNFTTNCVRCHDGVSAAGKDPAHLNTSDVCETCHEKHPANWAPVAPASVDHNEVIGTCASCHNGTAAGGKGATHISSTDNCDSCHAPGPIPWMPVAPSAVDHSQVLGTCISCHDGTIASGKPAIHISSTGNCDACHAVGPTPWAPVASTDVDHGEVIGTCGSCHNGTVATGKSAIHINTTDVCDACHAPGPTPWQPVAAAEVDHNEVIGVCSSCHNGTTASGKSVTHINTTDNCDACHAPGPTPWAPVAPANVDHNEVIGTCSSCHNGATATGKSATHINTTDVCEACHAPAPIPWASVTTVDHNEVLGTCSVCHDGVTATGKHPAHIQTTAECNTCHTTFAWLPAVVDHNNFVNNCIECHNGTTATGKTGTHINSTNLCDACHEKFPAGWSPVPSSAVDHTQVIGSCESCHNATIATGKGPSHINTTNLCDACHAPGPTPWIPVAPQDVDHNQVIGACVSCHDNSTAQGKPADHPTTTDNCDACHNPAPTPWSSYNVDHNEVTGCQSCHDGGIARGKNNGHCPTTEDCDACHRTTSWGNTFGDC
ncbi:MAG: cytochrome C, partial [Gammaproteobacteria bacterium]|nr:cytochrome C [Gammaproteobacteria bacterium]